VISSASFVALRHRNFRLIWAGLFLSFTGSMMQNAALLWHVSLLVPPERKGLALGLVGLVKVAPIMTFSLISGVVADAWDRRKVMLVTQLAATAVAVALAVLTLRGLTAVWPIYALAALGAAVGAFDLPARQALVPSLVPREHLPNAISLNTIMFQTASVVGPSLGGIVIATSGVAWVYLANAISFSAVVAALLMMRNLPQRQPTESGARREDVSFRAALEGLRFVFRSPLIRSTMLLDFFATFFSSATALLPIFAQDVLRWRDRLRLAICRTGCRCGGDERSYGPDDRTNSTARADAAMGGHRLRLRHRDFWRVALVLADVLLPGDDRCDRHGQHDNPQHRAQPRNARSSARPDDRRQHDLLHGRPAAWRAGSRSRRQLVGSAVFGDQRWNRLSRLHDMGGGCDTRVAALSARDLGRDRGRAVTTIGLISDTHGLLRPGIAAIFTGVSRILHAGDVGGPSILTALSAVAPVEAVAGNVDDPFDPMLAAERTIAVGGLTIRVSHGHQLGSPTAEKLFAKYIEDVLVFGHTHKPSSCATVRAGSP
jgi:putative phosphoesterase